MGGRTLAVGVFMATACVTGLATPGPWRHAFLWNSTASEPRGLYRRVDAAPGVGTPVAFMAPPAAFPYANGQLRYLRRVPLLKTIAAGQGDFVCASGGQLTINGQMCGTVAARDSPGWVLPQWRECRWLGQGRGSCSRNAFRIALTAAAMGPAGRP